MAVQGEAASSLELGQPARPLGFDDPGCALELAEIRREDVVADEPQILFSKLVQGGAQRAHERDDSERLFEEQ